MTRRKPIGREPEVRWALVALTRSTAIDSMLGLFSRMGAETSDEGSLDAPQHDVTFDEETRLTLAVFSQPSVEDLAAKVLGRAIRWRCPALVVAECDPFRRPADWEAQFARDLARVRPFVGCRDAPWAGRTKSGRGADGMAYDGTGLPTISLSGGQQELPEALLGQVERWTAGVLSLPSTAWARETVVRRGP